MSNPATNSQMRIRKCIGILGMLLPVILMIRMKLGNETVIHSSLSCYYHTGGRDILVSILFTFGILLFYYKYERKDNILTNLAGLFAIIAAFFPIDETVCSVAVDYVSDLSITGWVHNISASAFFIILAYMSYFVFTRTDPENLPTEEKLKRNKIFKACGIVMGISIIIIGAYLLFLEKSFPGLKKFNVLFFLESISMFAFGISWLVKGEIILKDK